jgi:hypothetical protein
MKNKKESQGWLKGGKFGLLVGIILFFTIIGGQFINSILSFGSWLLLFVFLIEFFIAGALLVFSYQKLVQLKIHKVFVWISYLIIAGLIIWFTLIWIVGLELMSGIVGI